MTGEGLPVVAHLPDRQARAQDEQNVGVLDGEISGPVPNGPGSSSVERVVRGQRVGRAPRLDHRDAQAADHLFKGVEAARNAHARAGKDDWTPGQRELLKHGGRLAADQGLVVEGRLTGRLELPQRGRIDARALEIHRNVDPAGTGPPRRRQVPRPAEFVGDVFRVAQEHRRFGDLLHHGDDINLLIAKLAQPRNVLKRHAGLPLDLAGNDDHRYRIGKGAEDPVDGVDASRPRCHLHQGRLARDTGVRFGREGARLLVMTADIFQTRAAPHRVVEVHGAAAGNHEDMPHPVISQGFHDKIGQSDHGRSYTMFG